MNRSLRGFARKFGNYAHTSLFPRRGRTLLRAANTSYHPPWAASISRERRGCGSISPGSRLSVCPSVKSTLMASPCRGALCLSQTSRIGTNYIGQYFVIVQKQHLAAIVAIELLHAVVAAVAGAEVGHEANLAGAKILKQDCAVRPFEVVSMICVTGQAR